MVQVDLAATDCRRAFLKEPNGLLWAVSTSHHYLELARVFFG